MLPARRCAPLWRRNVQRIPSLWQPWQPKSRRWLLSWRRWVWRTANRPSRHAMRALGRRLRKRQRLGAWLAASPFLAMLWHFAENLATLFTLHCRKVPDLSNVKPGQSHAAPPHRVRVTAAAARTPRHGTTQGAAVRAVSPFARNFRAVPVACFYPARPLAACFTVRSCSLFARAALAAVVVAAARRACYQSAEPAIGGPRWRLQRAGGRRVLRRLAGSGGRAASRLRQCLSFCWPPWKLPALSVRRGCWQDHLSRAPPGLRSA